MKDAYICAGVRTPFGRFGGGLSSIRTDDLAALPIAALIARYPDLDWEAVDDVIYGCANQSGEDNRNVARMAALLAGLPVGVTGTTINRLCGSSLDAIAMAARCISGGDADLLVAGGVESMSRAPFVMGKAESAFARTMKLEDTTIGWRFINQKMHKLYGTHSMPETAENVATAHGIGRQDQDLLTLRSQQRAAAALSKGFLREEIIPVTIMQPKQGATVLEVDEHPRADTTLEKLAKLKPIVSPHGTITAGNASGINDGAAALIIASESAVARHGLTPKARIVSTVTCGVAPALMGFGPAPAIRKLLQRTRVRLDQIDVIELNEAFAAQVLAVTRSLGLSDDAAHVNPNGGAIALGHPLGASGARLVIAAVNHLGRTGGRYGLCTMCIGVGQGIAMLVERV